MNGQQLQYVWVVVATSLVLIALWTGWIGVLMLAVVATFLTMGLKTGSLAPHFPSVSRNHKPVVFWIAMIVCATVLVGNIVRLILKL
jgi:hypothetical protein